MRAAVVNTLGQAPTYQESPEPIAQEGEVLIRMRTAGLHPIVKGLAAGTHYASGGELPLVPGLDGVGLIEDGSRVYVTFARKPWGTMCEQTVAPRARLLRLPDGVDDVQAAAIVNPGMSAWLSLKERAGVRPGETVLVMGATGVAGQLALQAAKLLGAKRIIAAGRNVDAIAKESVDRIIALGDPEDKVREALAEEAVKGVDVVIDYLWGRPTELLLEALARGFKSSPTRSTRLVEVGESAGSTISLPGSTLRSIDVRLMGSGFGSVSLEGVIAAIPTLFDMAAKGVLHVQVEPVPLAEVETAWSRVEKGRRIVFTI